MSLRMCSRAYLTRMLVTVICGCTLTALLLLTNVQNTLQKIGTASAESKLEEYANNEPGPGETPLDLQAPLADLRAQGPEYAFQWSHWVNLSQSEQYDYGNLDPALFPHLSTIDDLSQMPMPFTLATTQRESAMIGELYCRHHMPAPRNIVALHDSENGTFAPPEIWPVRHANNELNHRQYGFSEYVEQIPTTVPLAPDFLSSNPAVRLLPSLDESLFKWDARAEADQLEQGSLEDQNHSKMLRAAVAQVKTSKKHLEEVHLLFDGTAVGNHYDWRFFDGVETHDEHVLSIQALVRTWSQFSAQFGVEAWWAHGSALGWLWNGLAMPWDADTDIQVPVRTLDRLAREFNRTLIVQAPGDGARAYLLDVSPWYVERSYGNGMNVIDARFIDTTTGVYADITGLAYYGRNSKTACKNSHYYSVDELSPLRRTVFEGAQGYVPAQIRESLKTEYNEAFNPNYKKWKFNAKSRLWSNVDTSCKDSKEHWDSMRCYPVDVLPWPECKYALYGTCDRLEIAEFDTTKDYTQAHELEMELWNRVPFDSLENARAASAVSELIEHLDVQYPLMHRSE